MERPGKLSNLTKCSKVLTAVTSSAKTKNNIKGGRVSYGEVMSKHKSKQG